MALKVQFPFTCLILSFLLSLPLMYFEKKTRYCHHHPKNYFKNSDWTFSFLGFHSLFEIFCSKLFNNIYVLWRSSSVVNYGFAMSIHKSTARTKPDGMNSKEAALCWLSISYADTPLSIGSSPKTRNANQTPTWMFFLQSYSLVRWFSQSFQQISLFFCARTHFNCLVIHCNLTIIEKVIKPFHTEDQHKFQKKKHWFWDSRLRTFSNETVQWFKKLSEILFICID